MTTITSASDIGAPLAMREPTEKEIRLVIAASSAGTIFEWYDFFIYGTLAAVIGAAFFPSDNETLQILLVWAGFAVGFGFRPLGAILFGYLGDRLGRKYTFLVTVTLMGVATAGVGMIPTAASIGVAAPIIVIGLRILQGLALGGEYGGAAIYVAEHAPDGKRGLHTSWIQTTAAFGLLLSLFVIMGARAAMPTPAFEAWGWRIPFLISIFLLAISLWIRMRLNESPVFQRMKDEGETSVAPFRESFGKWPNLKIVLIALFGCVAGQAVTFYTGTFYALYYIERILKVDGLTTNVLMAWALVLGAPLYVLFGWLSDRIGRKPIIMAGLACAALFYFPLFKALTAAANPALAAAQASAPVTVVAEDADCSFQFDPVGRRKFDRKPCDIAKSMLARASVAYRNAPLEAGGETRILIGAYTVVAPDLSGQDASRRAAAISAFQEETAYALAAVGYPAVADPERVNRPLVVLLVVLLLTITTMCYGPMAALLVELFPAKIRYTSMSLPYHIGNGWFGGLMPTTAFAIIAATGDIYAGIWYPVIVAAGTLVIGVLFLPETLGRHVRHGGQSSGA